MNKMKKKIFLYGLLILLIIAAGFLSYLILAATCTTLPSFGILPQSTYVNEPVQAGLLTSQAGDTVKVVMVHPANTDSIKINGGGCSNTPTREIQTQAGGVIELKNCSSNELIKITGTTNLEQGVCAQKISVQIETYEVN